MKPVAVGRARAAIAIAAVGFVYIGYLFVLACNVLVQGIPNEGDYYAGRLSLEVRLLSFASIWGFVPLAVFFVLIVVLARTSHDPERSRLAYIFLVVGFPCAAVAYFVWYRLGW